MLLPFSDGKTTTKNKKLTSLSLSPLSPLSPPSQDPRPSAELLKAPPCLPPLPPPSSSRALEWRPLDVGGVAMVVGADVL